jgi:glucose-1-phosphate thymidylyltransferase
MNVSTAVVLAAGEGTRLRPLTHNRPKPMLPAANRPILEYVFDALVDTVDDIVVVVGYKHDRVQGHFGPTYRGVDLTYVHQEKQLGSGHALLQARDVVDEPMVVLNGDRVIDTHIVTDVVDAFESEGDPTMSVLERPETSQYGAVSMHGEDVVELVEKPDSDEYRLINAGVYAFAPSIFEAIAATDREAGELALTDTLIEIMERNRIRGVRTEGMWVDATYPWDLLAVAEEVLARGHVAGEERAAGVHVDSDAIVHDSAVLQPPVVVGPDCEVGAGAVLGPDVALGQNVTVAANATLRRSVIDADSRIEAGSTLIDAVTGQDVFLGAGSTVPGGPADVRVGREVFPDQRLGAVLADRVVAEGDASFSPGTLVGPRAHIGTGVNARGAIGEGAEVVR